MSGARSSGGDWWAVENAAELESPGLLVYPERVEENIRRMVAIAGDPTRLRPHVKTHKLPQVTARQLAAGINKFKAATIAEAEMAAGAGAAEVLLSYQPVGPNVRRLLELIDAFPRTTFACLLDDLDTARTLSSRAAGRNKTVNVLLDIDCGQHRTGVDPGQNAIELFRELARLPGLVASGLHAYDGHIHTSDPGQRERECEDAFAPVAALRDRLLGLGFPVETMVVGGTPTFPYHARRAEVECSPGTCVLWDFGYESQFPDLNFLPAALVLTRVISKPGNNRLCLDLGHKAVASENPPPRVRLLNDPQARAISHSEEHLVIETDRAAAAKVGDCWYGIPWHICPTVALHAQAVAVRQGRAVETWRIEARDRHLRH